MRSPKYWHTNFLTLVNRLFNLCRTYYMPTRGHTFCEPDELGQDQYHNAKTDIMDSLLQDCLGTSDLVPGRCLNWLDDGNVPRRPTSGRSEHLHELHTGLINLKRIGMETYSNTGYISLANLISYQVLGVVKYHLTRPSRPARPAELSGVYARMR
jgi:hypothetical protein